MKIYILGPLLFFYCLSLHASCRVSLCNHLLYIKKIKNPAPVSQIHFESCKSDEIAFINDLLSNFTGTLSTRDVQRMGKDITLVPDSISVYNAEKLINVNLETLFKDKKFQKIDLLSSQDIFCSPSQITFKTVCPDCQKKDNINFQFLISNSDKFNNFPILGQAQVLSLVDGIVMQSGIGAGSNMNQAHIVKSKVLAKTGEILFSNENSLKFYRALRNIEKGEYIKFTDLVPYEIVHPGTPVNVFYHQNGMDLKVSGMAMQGGQINDFISVKINSKISQARIIDFNTLEVQL